MKQMTKKGTVSRFLALLLLLVLWCRELDARRRGWALARPSQPWTTTRLPLFVCGGADNTDTAGFSLSPDETELNWKAHEAEIEENTRNSSYFQGPCSNLPPGLLETKGYNVGNITLPDFNDEFRSSCGNDLVQVTAKPLLTKEECDTIIHLAESYFEQNGWSSLPSGRFEIAGSWIKDIPPIQTCFNELLQTKLFPALALLFPDVVTDPSDLCVQSAYLFKYTPESGEKTDMHVDSSLLSFTILLNDPEDFEGGGTFFEALGEHGEVVTMNKGDVTFRPAGLRHRGQPITKGKRYVIGGFVTLRNKCEHVRQLITRGTRALADGDTRTASKLFQLAQQYNPQFAEAYMSVAHCQRKHGDLTGALESYKAAHEANPRSADSAFMVGVMYGELGQEEDAMHWYRIAAHLNEYDGDAWYRQGLILGRRGDVDGERAMYEKTIAVQPNHADANCNLGVIYGESGDTNKEIQCYERALKIEPSNEDALNNLKSAYYYRGVNAYQQGDLDASLASFRHILDNIEPDEPSILQAYDMVLAEKQAKEQGISSSTENR